MALITSNSDGFGVETELSDLCVFCLRPSVEIQSSKNRNKVGGGGSAHKDDNRKRLFVYLKLLSRYIGLECCEQNNSFSTSTDNLDSLKYLGSCGNCLSILEEFCRFYNEIKILELKMNGKLDLLCGIMRTVEKASLRIKGLENSSFQKEKSLKDLHNLRNNLLEKGSVKLLSADPKIAIQRSKIFKKYATKNGSQRKKDFENSMGTSDNTNLEAFISSEPIKQNVENFYKTESLEEENIRNDINLDDTVEDLSFSRELEAENQSEACPIFDFQSDFFENTQEEEENLSNSSNKDYYSETNDLAQDDLICSSAEEEETKAKKKLKSNKNLRPRKRQSSCKISIKDEEDEDAVDINSKRGRRRPKKISEESSHSRSRCTFSSSTAKLSPEAQKLFGPMKKCLVKKCRKEFFTDAGLEIHKKLHSEFKCNFCEKIFDYAPKLIFHEVTHVGNLQIPTEEHNSKNLLSCPRCPYTTGRKKFLSTHFIESHLEMAVDYQKCPICNNRFYCISQRYFRYSFKLHLQAAHDYTKKIYRCNESGCGAYFNLKFQQAVHQYKHKFTEKIVEGGNKVIECKICGKTFTKRKSFKFHYNETHMKKESNCDSKKAEAEGDKDEDDESCVCHHCGKTLKNSDGLATHISRVHEKSSPVHVKPKTTYVCETCGKNCTTTSILKRHMLTHTGPESWRFECTICGKRCIIQQKLDEHMRTHSNEKPFSCEYCGSRYAHRHNLRLHVKNKHGDIRKDLPFAKKVDLIKRNLTDDVT